MSFEVKEVDHVEVSFEVKRSCWDEFWSQRNHVELSFEAKEIVLRWVLKPKRSLREVMWVPLQFQALSAIVEVSFEVKETIAEVMWVPLQFQALSISQLLGWYHPMRTSYFSCHLLIIYSTFFCSFEALFLVVQSLFYCQKIKTFLPLKVLNYWYLVFSSNLFWEFLANLHFQKVDICKSLGPWRALICSL